MSETPITDEWLVSVDFKWRQEERQPNKHYSLQLNLIDDSWSKVIEPTQIELQRCGSKNGKGECVGDPSKWMVWIKDRFDRTSYIRNFRFQEEVIAFCELLMGRDWKPENHVYGQAWPDGSRAIEEKKTLDSKEPS